MENYEQKRIKKLKQGNIRKRKGGCQLKEKNKLMQDINFCTGINKNKKGVTLVALVVTIVVLLILAGVSIAMLSGDNGLIKQAQNASEEWEIAQDKEQLELAKQAEIAKGKGYIDVDDYFDRLENEGIVNDKDADIVDNGDGTYDVTTENGNTFEVTPVPDEENAEDIEIDYVGQGEIVGPRINKINVTEKTKTSISIEVITRNAEGGNYTYSYKKATDSSYTQAQTTANNTYTFTNLEENTEYDIKVKLETSEGSIEKTITVQTKAEEIEEPDPPEEEIPEGTITFGTVTWSGGKASIKISTTSEYEIEYQLNGTAEGRWTNLPSNGTISNLTHNTTVNARLVNGSKRGEIQSTTIQDTTKPTVTVTQQGSATTNSIAVSVQATDNESGMIANPTYTYFIKKTTEQNYTQKESNQTNNYTFTGLDQETSYDIKVEVQGDKAGNKGEGTLTGITTGKVTGGTEQGAITFGTPTWSEGQANIQVSTNTSYKIEYQLNTTTGNWTEIANNGTIQNISHNTTIYARLTDGNNHGDHASTTIKDTVNPTVTIQSLTAQDTTIQITAKGTDNETGINEYIYSIKESTQEDSNYVEKTRNTTGTATIEGMEAGKTYTVKVEVTDNAGLTGNTTQDIKIKKLGISSEIISNNAGEYFGGVVSNYDSPTDAGIKWRIFYADEENIYLIAAEGVEAENLPHTKNGNYPSGGDERYPKTAYVSYAIMQEYQGSADIDTKVKKWLSYVEEYPNNTNNNMKAVAYMLDTEVWNVFAGEQAEYAIGGPTLDLFVASYNKTHPNDTIGFQTQEYGYKIKWNKYSSYQDEIEGIDTGMDSLYANAYVNGYWRAWIASPSNSDTSSIGYNIFSSGRGNSTVGLLMDDMIDQITETFRPVVCLKAGVTLEKQEDGTYHIIDTVRTGKITVKEINWENEQASIKVSTNTDFQIEYQIGKIDEEGWDIVSNGTITDLKDGDTVYVRLKDGINYGDYASITISKEGPGTYYDVDTEIQVGEYPVTIPAGATISKIPGEYESVEDGLVIYITNGDVIRDWSDTETIQRKYDQFVWIPVDKDTAIVEEGKEITGSTNSEKYSSLQNYVSTNKKYPMAVKKSDGTYSGIIYDFEGTTRLEITPEDYTKPLSSHYGEPEALNNGDDAIDSQYGITETTLQSEYKKMLEKVVNQEGFWVGRYETTNMNSSDFTTDAVNVVKETVTGISDMTWYKMYEGQKEYKNKELINSKVTSSMIWGSQWDQIMLWMKDVKNGSYYYIVNAVGMANVGGEDDEDENEEAPAATGKREEYKVKNIYDLAGNVYEWSLESHIYRYGSYKERVAKGSSYSVLLDSATGASSFSSEMPTYNDLRFGSRLTLY